MDKYHQLFGKYSQDYLQYTEKEPRRKKKLSAEAFEHIKPIAPCIPKLLSFLVVFYELLVSLNVAHLDRFISEYKNDSLEAVSVFASGLKKDYEAVKNSLLYPKISNGPIEGTNNKIKMIRKRGYGRAGIELLNALAVLPWYYRDIDEKSQTQTTTTVARAS